MLCVGVPDFQIDEVQAIGERYRAAFAARHGREPEFHDRFDDPTI